MIDLPTPDLTMPSIEPDGPDGAHFYRASTVRGLLAQQDAAITWATEGVQQIIAERDALKAAQQWQPIETAPAERRVLVFEPGINGDGRTIAHGWRGQWFAGDIKDENEVWPTHWMPLPPSPAPDSQLSPG
jgi:hypothetical protein